MLETTLALLTDPHAWASLAALAVLEIVLGIDNVIFLSIVTSRLPAAQQPKARRIGLLLAMGMRLVMLAGIAWLTGLTAAVFTVLGHEVSWRDIVLLGGGLFLLYKATVEIHQLAEGGPHRDAGRTSRATFAAVILQVMLLDAVFSIDSVITAVGMAEHLEVMMAAVVIAIAVMMVAAEPISRFVNTHPTVKMLALGFLLVVGVSLVADGMDFHIPRGYIYVAIAFSALIEALNLIAAGNRQDRAARDRFSAPKSMRAAVTPGMDHVARGEGVPHLPTPLPVAGEVLVRVEAAAPGVFDPGAVLPEADAERPLVRGMDIIGVVHATGPGVPTSRRGELVAVVPVGDDLGEAVHGLPGLARDGGFAEFVVVRDTLAIPIESDLSHQELATLVGPASAAEAVLDAANVGVGDGVLVGGGPPVFIGAVVQGAALRGARVVVATPSGAHGRALKLGAALGVRPDEPDLTRKVAQALGGDGLTVVIDGSGGGMAPRTLGTIARGGRFVALATSRSPHAAIDLATVQRKRLTVRTAGLPTPDQVRRAVRLVNTGRLTPMLLDVTGLEGIAEAERLQGSGASLGTYVVLPQGTDGGAPPAARQVRDTRREHGAAEPVDVAIETPAT